MEYGSGCYDGRAEIVDSESFERSGLEMLEQTSHGGVGREYPVVKVKCEVFGRQFGVDVGASAAFHQHFFSERNCREVCRCGQVFPGLQEIRLWKCREMRHPQLFVHNVYSREKIVFAVVEDIVVDGYSRVTSSVIPRLTSFFVAFGVFKLLAYGHTLAGSDQTRQISVQGAWCGNPASSTLWAVPLARRA